MEYKEGQELVSGHLSRDRHYKVISVKPVYSFNKAGKKKLTHTLITLENQKIKRSDFANMSDLTFGKMKVFEISESELDKLVGLDVLKLKT